MDRFQCLFGVKSEEVKDNCIVMPVLRKDLLKGFGVTQIFRGKLYCCAHTAHFTIVNTGVGAGVVGDAVLYLQEAGCQIYPEEFSAFWRKQGT